MSLLSLVQTLLFVILLTALAAPLGSYIARVFEGRAPVAARVLGPVERLFYRLAGVRADREMAWKEYATAVLVFHLAGTVLLYGLIRLQGSLPWNPARLPDVPAEVAWNTAISFTTNTDWQSYSGETTMSHLVQTLGLTVQNFLSAAAGIAVLFALVRALARSEARTIGNFWVDLTRGTLYLLLPLSFVLALALVAAGAVQSLDAQATFPLLSHNTAPDGQVIREQTLALGPVASQVAIKQLGTNGGGFFNVSSAHPFENPSALSNALELLAILLIPAALCFSFGAMVKDRRQGISVYAAMMVLFVPLVLICVYSEQRGNPLLAPLGVDQAASALAPGGNMEGKEVRFGPFGSALWATATTAASNGAVNAMHDSFLPLGGLVPLWLMSIGEVVFGGVGSGLYGMLMYIVIAVLISGLLVGRTPEYLGKKVEAFEMKMASLAVLLPAAATLLGAALAVSTSEGKSAILNPGPHGFTEIFYAFSSGANNNGSAFAGLTANGPFYAIALGVVMWVGRYGVIAVVLAAAGSFARKKRIPQNAGTLPTHTPLFVALVAGTVILAGALTFVPALALGPIVEELSLNPH